MMSNVQLLTIQGEFASAKTLGFATTCDVWDIDRHNIVIRWGNSETCYEEFPHVINSSSAIHHNCLKNKALEVISSVAPVPTRFLSRVPKGHRAVVRYFTHSGGKEFLIKDGPWSIPKGMYATEFIDTQSEFRVWFCNGNVLYAKRVPMNGKQKGSVCRSEWGYYFLGDWGRDVPTLLKNYTLKAAKALRLKFGAADVLVKDGKYYFLELNSAPTMDSKIVREFFKANLAKLIEKFAKRLDTQPNPI